MIAAVEGLPGPMSEAVQAEDRDGRGCTGVISQIQRWSLHDGPGIRSTVFLKGCPLRCIWCHNPELQAAGPTLLFSRDVCTSCGRCIAACPNSAVSWGRGRISFRRGRCQACGACAKVCLNEARELIGSQWSVQEVICEVLRDKPFYAASGGGVTVSGGEPLAQPEFAQQILLRARMAGLHTALDTCGYAPLAALQGLVRYADLVLYDIKNMDPIQHRRQTGVSNALILANLAWLLQGRHQVWIRVPVLRGQNDSDENYERMVAFLSRVGRPTLIELLPYHEIGLAKSIALGRRNRLDGTAIPTSAQLQRATSILEAVGVPIKVAT